MKVLIVVARRYNGHELWTTLGIFQETNIDFEVISTKNVIFDEMDRRPNKIERTIKEINPEDLKDFDGLMIVSGNMDDTEAYWDDERVLGIVDEAHKLGLTIGAICCSVPTIRNVAKGKRVSFYPLVRAKERLMEAGVIPQTMSISVDDKLITAEHQMATAAWAKAFIEVLEGKDSTLDLHDSGFEPLGRSERALPHILERIRGTDISYRLEKDEDGNVIDQQEL